MSDNRLEKTVTLGMTDRKGDQLDGGVTISVAGAILQLNRGYIRLASDRRIWQTKAYAITMGSTAHKGYETTTRR